MKKNLKDNRGSITSIILVTVLFFLTILSTAYMVTATLRKSQMSSELTVKETYESDFDRLEEIKKEVTGSVDISGLKIGDYIDYETQSTTATYVVSSEYSGSENDQIIIRESFKWRILDINNNEDTITLISETPSNGTITLVGASGYNNGVYLLNSICGTLYSNSEKGATARSINIEDIQNRMDWGSYAAQTSGGSYGSIKTLTPSSSINIKYPYEWKLEKGDNNKIGSQSISGTIGTSEQRTLTSQTYESAANGITYTQTGWDGNVTFNQIDYENLLTADKSFLIASRTIASYGTNEDWFGLQTINNGSVSSTAGKMFKANVASSDEKTEATVTNSIQPIVTIPTSKLDLTQGDGTSTSPYKIK